MDPLSATLSGQFSGSWMNGGAAAPSSAGGGSAGGGMFDGSGWNVNFGSGSITSSRSAELSKYMPYILVGVAGLLAWRYLKKH